MNEIKKQRNIGILAHVDAGKTTLTESMLYVSGMLRQAGRVDHGDTFLDYDTAERERGITIFSKQARLSWKTCQITLLDTPGHTDFSGEAERALSVLDAAVLVISASDGVQGHTRTLWRLLEQYQVPVFIFVNKMDRPDTEEVELLTELRQKLSPLCASFSMEEWKEQAATESEEAMNAYLETGDIPVVEIQKIISERKLFPCLFGSALQNVGVQELLYALVEYAPTQELQNSFVFQTYKISRDAKGERLTWLRLLGGELHAKEIVNYVNRKNETISEKVHQIRLYSGEKYEMVDAVPAGTVCAVTGLTETFVEGGILQPVYTYQVVCNQEDPFVVYQKLQLLQEEEPLLRPEKNEATGEIRLQLMGNIQTEVLTRRMQERFGLQIGFAKGSVLYLETIENTVEGVGHFEPLRHYAEVHLLLEPLERGSGIVLDSRVSTDTLDLNWQRLILTHLAEKEHKGVLIGAPITDIKITLVAGKAHEKHTEGGDFRQATYRAVRQGLMQAKNILMEPWYEVTLELPSECVGHAMADFQRMNGEFESPEIYGDECILRGRAPVAEMTDYAEALAVYSSGRGQLSCVFSGYRPCQNATDLILSAGYDPTLDVENTPDSVFCSHGSGFVVPWNEVKEHMHLESELHKSNSIVAPEITAVNEKKSLSTVQMDQELRAIFEKTYGPIHRREIIPRVKPVIPREKEYKAKPLPQGEEYLLVDGYNILHAWPELKVIAEDQMAGARQTLMDWMCNYQSVRGCHLILVFDAYRVPYHKEEIIEYHNIHVVYTKQAETADAYIEKASQRLAKEHKVRVATSDSLEQLIILGQGALRQSADAFRTDYDSAMMELKGHMERVNAYRKNETVAEAFRAATKNA